MTRRIPMHIAAAALSLATASVARAQEHRPTPGEPAAAGGEHRREAFRVVDAYVVSNLQESLGLTDAEFVKVLPLVKKLQTDRREYLLARGRLLQQLRRQLRSGTADEATVRQTLDELKKAEAAGPELARANLGALDAVLSPLQQAKYRVLELEVEQRLRELMGRARDRGALARPPRE